MAATWPLVDVVVASFPRRINRFPDSRATLREEVDAREVTVAEISDAAEDCTPVELESAAVDVPTTRFTIAFVVGAALSSLSPIPYVNAPGRMLDGTSTPIMGASRLIGLVQANWTRSATRTMMMV